MTIVTTENSSCML